MKRIASYLLGWVVLACLSVVSVTGCVEDNKVNDVTPVGNEYAIYLVANVDPANLYAVQSSSLADLELQPEPWLSLTDIDYYDVSTHYIYLKITATVPEDEDKKSFVKPFVVVVNGERCYLGYSLSMASSYLPHGPYIQYPTFLADDVVAMENRLMDGEIDVRNDSRIIEVFAKAGKLNPGLKVTLTDAMVVNRAEVVTMSYSFTITNESDNPLYIPDPDKMGSVFHYYTNGLYLTKADNSHESVWASQKPVITLTPFDKWDIDWYYKLGSHESIKRTVELSGYTGFTGGVYRCYFTYSGPGTVSRDDRTRSDGVIWLGEIDSSTIEIRVDN